MLCHVFWSQVEYKIVCFIYDHEGHHQFLQRKVYSWEEYKVENKQMKVVIDIKKTCLFKCIKQLVKNVLHI